MKAAIGYEDSEGASNQSQECAFRQKLPQDAATPRSQRGAESDLSFARCGAREHQIGHVRARNQQDKADGCEQDKKCGPVSECEVVVDSHYTRKVLLINAGILFLQGR